MKTTDIRGPQNAHGGAGKARTRDISICAYHDFVVRMQHNKVFLRRDTYWYESEKNLSLTTSKYLMSHVRNRDIT